MYRRGENYNGTQQVLETHTVTSTNYSIHTSGTRYDNKGLALWPYRTCTVHVSVARVLQKAHLTISPPLPSHSILYTG